MLAYKSRVSETDRSRKSHKLSITGSTPVPDTNQTKSKLKEFDNS